MKYLDLMSKKGGAGDDTMPEAYRTMATFNVDLCQRTAQGWNTGTRRRKIGQNCQKAVLGHERTFRPHIIAIQAHALNI